MQDGMWQAGEQEPPRETVHRYSPTFCEYVVDLWFERALEEFLWQSTPGAR